MDFVTYFNSMGNNPLAILFKIMIGLIFSAAAILLVVLFLSSLYKNLKGISPQNRKMEPGLVWLNLIPIFSLGWMIYTVTSISESNRAEFKEKNIDQSVDMNFGVGLAYSTLMITSLIPFIKYITCIPCIVCWIIFWTTTSNMTKVLKDYNMKNLISSENNTNSGN